MTIEEAIAARHSVRQYKDTPLSDEHIIALRSKMEQINRDRGLHLQLILGEPKAFSGFLARYIKFSGAVNYIALVGKKADDLKEKLGYEGEKLVLMAQQMGLNTCWVAGSFSKNKAVQVGKDEKFVAVIAIGYGENQGKPHVSKPVEEVASLAYTSDWFQKGVECAMLAPSAMNKQNFKFAQMADGKVMATAGHGAYAGLDLGIAKLHFEIGSGKDSTIWK
ncbi:MAG: nitroreductase [Bacteroidaceae bacterium]|nr:nitroreductase [Bacteroidaceae bacterium]